MRLLFCGFYGCGNLGDDALLFSCLSELSRMEPRLAFSYLTGGERSLARLLSAAGIEARGVSRMRPSVLSAIRESDAVILGGGSVLQNATGALTLPYYLSLLRVAQLFGKRTAILAGGLGPIRGALSRSAVSRVLSRLDHGSFRDREAAEAAEALGVRDPACSADLTVLLSPCSADRLPPLPTPYFLVSLREKSGFSVEKAARQAAALALRRNLTPVFCDLFPREDRAYTAAVSREVSRLLAAAGAPWGAWELPNRCFRADPAVLLGAAAGAELVLSMRYHLCLFARVSGTPCLALGRDPKFRAVAAEERTAETLREAARRDLSAMLHRLSDFEKI